MRPLCKVPLVCTPKRKRRKDMTSPALMQQCVISKNEFRRGFGGTENNFGRPIMPSADHSRMVLVGERSGSEIDKPDGGVS